MSTFPYEGSALFIELTPKATPEFIRVRIVMSADTNRRISLHQSVPTTPERTPARRHPVVAPHP
jgi:hypothetical protein